MKMKVKIFIGLLIMAGIIYTIHYIDNPSFQIFPAQKIFIEDLCQKAKATYHLKVPQIPINKVRCVVNAKHPHNSLFNDLHDFNYDITLQIDTSDLVDTK